MEVVLGTFVDFGLLAFFVEALVGGDGVSRGDSCGERSEFMSMTLSKVKAQGINAY